MSAASVARWSQEVGSSHGENVPSANSGGAESADAVQVMDLIATRKLVVEIKVPRELHVARAAQNENTCVDCSGACLPKNSAFS